MEKESLMITLSSRMQLKAITEMNQYTRKFGLVLSEKEAELLVQARIDSLKDQRRVEFGKGILPELIFTFCDSPYITQDEYCETLSRLQDIFYLYKNESMDELTDQELLEVMKTAFDGECAGSLEFLEETALESFARKIRKEGKSFFGNHYEVKRWKERNEI